MVWIKGLLSVCYMANKTSRGLRMMKKYNWRTPIGTMMCAGLSQVQAPRTESKRKTEFANVTENRVLTYQMVMVSHMLWDAWADREIRTMSMAENERRDRSFPGPVLDGSFGSEMDGEGARRTFLL